MALEKKQRKMSVAGGDGGGATAAGDDDESENGTGGGASLASTKDANWEHCRRGDRALAEDIPVPGHKKWREAPGTCGPHSTKPKELEYRDFLARRDRTRRGPEAAAQTRGYQALNDL